MTSSPLAVLRGAQEPRVRSVPPGAELAPTGGDEAADLAAMAGLHLMPWQRLVLREALRERPDGRLCAFEVGLVVPRQNGKGSVLEALELAALFFADPDGQPPLVLHSAHEFKTSAEHFRRMRMLIEYNDTFNARVRSIKTASGAESIELDNGARLRFVTRSGGSGRGFSADLVIIDEAYNLSPETMAAILPTLSARPNPQVWYTSSAGMVSSAQLANIRRRGVKGGDPSLAFFEWSAEDGCDLDDREAWAQANPALGHLIPESFVVSERAALPDEQFGRERLGLWADADAGTAAIDPGRWALLADPSADRGLNPVFGVATAPDRSWAAIAVAWRRPDRRVQVMLADYKQTPTWLGERTSELRARWGGRVIADTPSRGLVDGALEPSQQAQAQADNTLSDAVVAESVRHGNDPALNVSVKGARWRALGDTRVLDRKGSLDITPLRAASLAVWGVTESPDYNLLDSVR